MKRINMPFSITSIVLGLWMIFIAVYCYWSVWIYVFQELTFWSNFLGGFLLVLGAIYEVFFHKQLPRFLYFDVMIILLLVMGVSLGFGYNFQNGFQYLHVMNPVLYFLFWIIFIDHTKDRISRLVVAPLAILFPYLLILVVFLGGYYPQLSVQDSGVLGVFLFIVITLGIILIVSRLTIQMNRYIHSLEKEKYGLRTAHRR